MTVVALDIVNGALRYVGAYSPYDVAPDPAEADIALDQLDMLLAEKVGTEALWFFVPATETVTLNANIDAYALNTVTTNDLQFIREAQLLYDGKETPLDLIRREDFEEKRNDGTTEGNPEFLYIERKDNPTMHVLSKPTITGYSIKLWGQKYAPDVTQNNGQIDVEFPKAWKRALTLKLAIDIGLGPVVKLPRADMQELKEEYIVADNLLKSFNNRSNVRRPRFTANRNF